MNFWMILAYVLIGIAISYVGGRVWETSWTDSPGPLFALVGWPLILPFLVAEIGRQRTRRERQRRLVATEEQRKIDKLLESHGVLPPKEE